MDRVLYHANHVTREKKRHRTCTSGEATNPRANDDLSYKDRVPLPSTCPRLVHVIQTEEIAVGEFVGEDVVCVVSVKFSIRRMTTPPMARKQQA